MRTWSTKSAAPPTGLKSRNRIGSNGSQKRRLAVIVSPGAAVDGEMLMNGAPATIIPTLATSTDGSESSGVVVPHQSMRVSGVPDVRVAGTVTIVLSAPMAFVVPVRSMAMGPPSSYWSWRAQSVSGSQPTDTLTV